MYTKPARKLGLLEYNGVVPRGVVMIEWWEVPGGRFAVGRVQAQPPLPRDDLVAVIENAYRVEAAPVIARQNAEKERRRGGPADPPTDEELSDMRARCDAALPLPWWSEPAAQSLPGRSDDLIIEILFAGEPGAEMEVATLPGERWAEAEFIANARRDIPQLLNEVERLRREAS